jgi:ketosteroid isomerase-like protein
MVQAWYPAVDAGVGRAARLPEWERHGSALTSRARQQLAAPTASYLDATPRTAAQQPRQVVLLSHGLGQRRTDYVFTAEALASRGVIVLAVDHPGGAARIAWRDGSVSALDPEWEAMSPPRQSAEAYAEFTERQLVDWAADLRLVMTRAGDAPGIGLVLSDASALRWGAVGHSMGGKAVALLCAGTPAIRACANLDGWPVPASVEQRGLPQAYLHVEDLRDASEDEFRAWGSSLMEYTRNMERLQDRRTAMMRNMRGAAYHVLMPGIRHASFTDWPSLDSSAVPEGAWRDARAALDEVASHLQGFFREHLLDEPQPRLHPTSEFTFYARERWLTPASDAAVSRSAGITPAASHDTIVPSDICAALDAANAAFSAAWMRGDVDAVVAAYTAHPVLHPPAGGVLTSPSAVRGVWAGITRLQRVGHRLEPLLRRPLGTDRVLEVGRWHSATRNAEGEAPWSSGCYSVVWERDAADGRWRMSYDGWTAPNPNDWACRPR